MTEDLVEQISNLPDDAAVAALVAMLDLGDASTDDVNELATIQRDFASSARPELGVILQTSATAGELARTTLAYLAERDSSAEVAAAVDHRPQVAQRDPVTLAIGGLVLLALKSEVELKRGSTGKWSFSYHLKPTKDSALANILGKLWALCGGVRP